MNNVEPKNMFTMFDLKTSNRGIFYWENVISYPEDLVKFIELLDSQEESFNIIPKWTKWTASNSDSTIYGEKKFISTDNKKLDTGNYLINKRALYISLKLVALFFLILRNMNTRLYL